MVIDARAGISRAERCLVEHDTDESHMEEEKGQKKKRVVLYPGVGVGHMAPMLELASALLLHGGGAFDVTVALVEPPASDPTFPGFAGAVARAKAAYSSVAFHVLPAPSPPPARDDDEHHMGRRLRFLRAMNAPLRDFLRSRTTTSSSPADVGALVLDMFCGDALDVAAELGVPAYFFFPSGGTGLACFLRLPAHRATLTNGFRELIHSNAVLTFPGAPPFRVADLPAEMTGDDEAAAAMFRMGARMPAARGILVNTFHSLEPRAVQALRDGLCVAGTPPVYCVGPLVSPGSDKDRDRERHHGLRWLDAQPDRSVVFLCFGSMGAFSCNQLARIATGLENSGQRFLWVVRTAGNNLSGGGAPPPEPKPSADDDDLDALLPAGFLQRTKDRGLVVSAWAPQADVLRHRATGAFVTHCGWNSVLEAVAAGLPMLCWPLYAEQRLNKVFVVDEMRLGVEVMTKKSRSSCTGEEEEGEEGDDDLVSAAEVEAKVRWVMEAEDSAAVALRARVAKARDAAAAALAEGGSSRADLLEFVRDFGG